MPLFASVKIIVLQKEQTFSILLTIIHRKRRKRQTYQTASNAVHKLKEGKTQLFFGPYVRDKIPKAHEKVESKNNTA
jgi:hypothetical protein